MGVVVLYLQQRQTLPPRPLPGIVGGEIVRMPVADQEPGLDIEQTLEMGDLPGVVRIGLEVLRSPMC